MELISKSRITRAHITNKSAKTIVFIFVFPFHGLVKELSVPADPFQVGLDRLHKTGNSLFEVIIFSQVNPIGRRQLFMHGLASYGFAI